MMLYRCFGDGTCLLDVGVPMGIENTSAKSRRGALFKKEGCAPEAEDEIDCEDAEILLEEEEVPRAEEKQRINKRVRNIFCKK
jgi:hypothetical protein